MIFSETELQDKLSKLIKGENLVDKIEGVNLLEDAIEKEQKAYIPSFLIDFKLHSRYIHSAKSIVECLSTYEEISGEKIKNISLNKSERLYPDYLLNNPETGQFILWELKKDIQTEREAITELLAYSLEIKNHLPLLSNFDIKLIIVSTKFNTLLEHAISMVLLGTSFEILCLKAEIVKSELKLSIHFPNSWSAIWQNNIPEKAFSSFDLNLNLKKKEVIDLKWLKKITTTTVDLIEFEGNRINSSGFCIFWYNTLDKDLQYPFGITICQINSYSFLQMSIERGFKHNVNGPLAKYILENSNSLGEYYHPNSLFKISEKAKEFLNQYFEFELSNYSNWDTNINGYNNFRSMCLPSTIGSWGDIGDYFRFLYLKSYGEGYTYFNKEELSLEKSYKDPIIGLQILNLLTDRGNFNNGEFKTSDLFKFLELLMFYGHLVEYSFNKKNKSEIAKARLFYFAIELTSDLKEIEYRVSCLKGKISAPPTISIFFDDPVRSVMEEITSFLHWFRNDFIGKDNIFQQFLFDKFLGWCQVLNSDRIFSNALDGQQRKIVNLDIASFVRDYCKLLMINQYYEKSANYSFDLKSFLEQMLNIDISISVDDSNKLNDEIDNINPDDLVEIFEPIFLELLDRTSPELYHEIGLSNNLLESIDWNHCKQQLIERHKEGFKFTMVKISNNGEIAIGNLPTDYRIMGEILDPNEEVFIKINFSGIGVIHRLKWVDIFSGQAFNELIL